MSQKTKKIRIGNQVQMGVSQIIILATTLALGLTYWALLYHNENAINGYTLQKVQEERSNLLFAIERVNMEIANLGKLKNEE